MVISVELVHVLDAVPTVQAGPVSGVASSSLNVKVKVPSTSVAELKPTYMSVTVKPVPANASKFDSPVRTEVKYMLPYI